MKKVSVSLDIHAFAEERLCDRWFDSPPDYGIVGPEIMKPLSTKRNTQMELLYCEDTLVDDLIHAVKEYIWNAPDFEAGNTQYAFLVDGERYYPDYQSNFQKLLNKYLDPTGAGTIVLTILVCHDAGDVGFEYPLRFYVNSHEGNRHRDAHIHVEDTSHQYSAAIRISDGEVIAGKLPKKLANIAKRTILSDQIYFIDCWNKQTDGLEVDINKHFGYIQY